MLKTIMNIRIIAKLRITTIFEITLTKWIINEKSIVIITDHNGPATTSYRLIKWYITQPTNKPTNKQTNKQTAADPTTSISDFYQLDRSIIDKLTNQAKISEGIPP